MARWAPLLLTLVLLASLAARRQTAPTIGIVNLQVLMEQTPGYEEARQAFQDELASYEQEITRMGQTLDSMISEYDRQQVVLSPTAREEKQAALREYQQRYQQRGQELNTRSQERQRELLAPLEDRVQSVIEGIRAERNLSIVFDIGAQGGAIVAADRGLELTAMVLERLGQQ